MMLSLCYRTALLALTAMSSKTNDREVDLDEYASSITSYIIKCVNAVTSTRAITVHLNQNPWLNVKVKVLLRAWDSVFRSGYADSLRAARRNFTTGIKRAKSEYALTIQGHFSTNDPQSMWMVTTVHRTITDYNNRDNGRPFS